MRRIAILFLSSFFISNFLFAAEEPNVQLHKLEDRTEAIVSAPAGAKAPVSEGKWLPRNLSKAENGIADFAAAGCGAVGKGTDVTITVIQKTFGFVLTPLFKALDVVNWGKGKKTS